MFKKLILVPGLGAISAFAQTPAPPPPKDLAIQKQVLNVAYANSFGAIGITAALAGPMSTIPGAPYSAQAVTQRIQTLADGNRITQTTTNNVARDSKGRVYREESLPGLGTGNPEPPHLILIEDPVAGMHITLDSNSKIAMKMPTSGRQTKRMDEAAFAYADPPMGIRVSGGAVGAGEPGPATDIQIVTSKKLMDEAKTTQADLGTQSVEGVIAKGTRITRTIPAGEMGNDMPIVITTETWFSPDLKVLVMSKSSDPRMGETTYKLTNLIRGEPDPTLFQIPADYTVKDQPQGMFVFKSDK
jgi:hypothetical protein